MGRTTTRSSSRKVNTPYNRPPARYPAGTSTFFPYATAASVHRIHTHSSLRIAFSVLPGSTTETLGYAIRTELMARNVIVFRQPLDIKPYEAHFTHLIAVAHIDEDPLQHLGYNRVEWAELLRLIYQTECQGAALINCMHGKIPSIPMLGISLTLFTEDHEDMAASLATFQKLWKLPIVDIPASRVRARSLTPPEFEGDWDLERHRHLLVAEDVPGTYVNYRDWPMGGSREGNRTGSGDPHVVAVWEAKMMRLGRAIRGTGETAPGDDDTAGDGHDREAAEAVKEAVEVEDVQDGEVIEDDSADSEDSDSDGGSIADDEQGSDSDSSSDASLKPKVKLNKGKGKEVVPVTATLIPFRSFNAIAGPSNSKPVKSVSLVPYLDDTDSDDEDEADA